MTIRELRTSRNLTQVQFAALIGVSRSDLGRMENGQKEVGDQVADNIWKVFGVEVDPGEGKKPVRKTAAKKLEIYIQSPMGGNITPEQIAEKMPKGTEACFVRVDQNKIWWVRGDGETGFEWIWD